MTPPFTAAPDRPRWQRTAAPGDLSTIVQPGPRRDPALVSVELRESGEQIARLVEQLVDAARIHANPLAVLPLARRW